MQGGLEQFRPYGSMKAQRAPVGDSDRTQLKTLLVHRLKGASLRQSIRSWERAATGDSGVSGSILDVRGRANFPPTAEKVSLQ